MPNPTNEFIGLLADVAKARDEINKLQRELNDSKTKLREASYEVTMWLQNLDDYAPDDFELHEKMLVTIDSASYILSIDFEDWEFTGLERIERLSMEVGNAE